MRSSIPGLRKDAIRAIAALTLIALATTPVPHIMAIWLMSQAVNTGNGALAFGGAAAAFASYQFFSYSGDLAVTIAVLAEMNLLDTAAIVALGLVAATGVGLGIALA
ncbi:hypothetical protein [Vulcanisaeta sp. JCM 14467]|uniref:hypothetical protein n=1 Tax=Vulcanisaeta sp. JCM 14467 TaxID=1295370 RepID=UPI000A463786|nr:hypothetical protein [Vulcanisaeta sp. JCM 14467]